MLVYEDFAPAKLPGVQRHNMQSSAYLPFAPSYKGTWQPDVGRIVPE